MLQRPVSQNISRNLEVNGYAADAGAQMRRPATVSQCRSPVRSRINSPHGAPWPRPTWRVVRAYQTRSVVVKGAPEQVFDMSSLPGVDVALDVTFGDVDGARIHLGPGPLSPCDV